MKVKTETEAIAAGFDFAYDANQNRVTLTHQDGFVAVWVNDGVIGSKESELDTCTKRHQLVMRWHITRLMENDRLSYTLISKADWRMYTQLVASGFQCQLNSEYWLAQSKQDQEMALSLIQ